MDSIQKKQLKVRLFKIYHDRFPQRKISLAHINFCQLWPSFEGHRWSLCVKHGRFKARLFKICHKVHKCKISRRHFWRLTFISRLQGVVMCKTLWTQYRKKTIKARLFILCQRAKYLTLSTFEVLTFISMSKGVIFLNVVSFRLKTIEVGTFAWNTLLSYFLVLFHFEFFKFLYYLKWQTGGHYIFLIYILHCRSKTVGDRTFAWNTLLH